MQDQSQICKNLAVSVKEQASDETDKKIIFIDSHKFNKNVIFQPHGRNGNGLTFKKIYKIKGSY